MKVATPKLQRNFAGLDGFIWAIGVVEDRIDPLLLGRCKVRYLGWHTEDKKEIPTEELPWSHPLLPLDSGRHVVGPKEGDWVMGFFRDGMVAQEPVMLGVWPGITEIEANPELGFNDPRPASELNPYNVPRDPLSFPMQTDSGAGSYLSELPSPLSRYPQNEPGDETLRYVDNKESTANRFERNEHIEETIVEIKRSNVGIGQTAVPKALHPDSNLKTDVTSFSIPWSEPPTPYAAKYPYNHAYFSESGHLVEVDDTPGVQRLHWYHRSGTFREIHPAGELVEKIVMDEYHICLKNRNTHIEASDNLTVDWNRTLYVNKDNRSGSNYDIQIGAGGNINQTIEQGNYNRYIIAGNETNRIGGFRYYRIDADDIGHVVGKRTVTIDKDDNLTVMGSGHICIMGAGTVRICAGCAVTIDGEADITVWDNTKLQIHGNLTTEVWGDRLDKTHGRHYSEVLGNKDDVVWGDYQHDVLGNRTHTTYKTNNEYVGEDEFIEIAKNRYTYVFENQLRKTVGLIHETSDYGIDLSAPELMINQLFVVLDPEIPTPPGIPHPQFIPRLQLIETIEISEAIQAWSYDFTIPEK